MKKCSLLFLVGLLATSLSAQKNLAKVEKYGGVYVFSDCSPIAEYEEIGMVNYSGTGNSSFISTPSYNMNIGKSSVVVPSTMMVVSETPQYSDIRNGLITNAVIANRQVEGVIIKIIKEGVGQATLIKFAEGATDINIAQVNSHNGLYVFTDCTPLQSYSYLGTIKGAGSLNTDYNVLRDKLCKKCMNKFKDTQAIILHFVTGGKDSAEAIKF